MVRQRLRLAAAALLALALSLACACPQPRPLPPGADPSLLGPQRGHRRGLQAAVRQPSNRACGVAPVSPVRPRWRPPALPNA